MAEFIIGRQQILDRKQNIYGYELLFRGNDFDLSNKNEATQATNQIITDSILELGLNNLVGSHKAFINFTSQNILEKMVDGKIRKFYEESTLMQQKYIRDPEKTMQDYLNELIAKIGEKIQVRRFSRYQLGE